MEFKQYDAVYNPAVWHIAQDVSRCERTVVHTCTWRRLPDETTSVQDSFVSCSVATAVRLQVDGEQIYEGSLKDPNAFAVGWGFFPWSRFARFAFLPSFLE